MPLPTKPEDSPSVQWFDGFTKVVLSVMFVLLLFIFLSGKYMDSHRMAAGGTDDAVNSMASRVSGTRHHPFIELPGDAEVGAFSVANFCAGLACGVDQDRVQHRSPGAEIATGDMNLATATEVP